jgi:hypothetical protein
VACVALTVACGTFLGHALMTQGIIQVITETEPFTAHHRVADAVRLDPDTDGEGEASAPGVPEPTSPSGPVTVVVPAGVDATATVRSAGRPTTKGKGRAEQQGKGIRGTQGNQGTKGNQGNDGKTGKGQPDGANRPAPVLPPSSDSSGIPTLENLGGTVPPGHAKGDRTAGGAIGHGQTAPTPAGARTVVGGVVRGVTSTVTSTVTRTVTSGPSGRVLRTAARTVTAPDARTHGVDKPGKRYGSDKPGKRHGSDKPAKRHGHGKHHR